MTTHPLGSIRIVVSLFYEETEKRKHFVQLLDEFSIVLRRNAFLSFVGNQVILYVGAFTSFLLFGQQEVPARNTYHM